jgi:hypothetical protein
MNGILAVQTKFAQQFKFGTEKAFMENKKRMMAEFDYMRAVYGSNTADYHYLVKGCIDQAASVGGLSKVKIELIDTLSSGLKGDALLSELFKLYGAGYISEGQQKRDVLMKMKREKNSLKETLDLYCARVNEMEARNEFEVYRIDAKAKSDLLWSFSTTKEQESIRQHLFNKDGFEASDFLHIRENPVKLLALLYRAAHLELALGPAGSSKGPLDQTAFSATASNGEKKKKKSNGGKGKKSWDPQSHTNGGGGRDPDKCGACNLSHQRGECPAKDTECRFCHKKGHWAPCCPKKRNEQAKPVATPGVAPADKPDKGFLKKVNFKTPNAKAFAAVDPFEMAAMAVDKNSFKALAESHGIEYWDSRDTDDSESVSSDISNAFATNSDAGEFQALYTKEEEKLFMCVDTGCTKSLLPPGFLKFAVRKYPHRTTITTAITNQTIDCKDLFVCRLPFFDTNGKLRYVKVEACITEQVPFPLLAASASTNLGWKVTDEKLKAIRLHPAAKGEGGVWVPLRVVGKVFAVEIATGNDAEHCLFAAARAKASLEDIILDFDDAGLAAGPAVKQPEKSDLELAELYHIRLGHPRGARLFNTLKQYGINVTRAQCKEIGDKCHACQTVGVAKVAVPEVTNKLYDQFAPGELCFQDLAFMQHPGSMYAGYSAIIDAHTRRVSAGVFKHKDQAIDHFTQYCHLMKTRRTPVRELRTDNGGEFIGLDYTGVCREYVVAHNTGAPWTPESQGMVERLNREIKGKLHKILFERGIPNKYWSFFLPGVVQQINATVHSTTGKVPSGKDKLPDIMCGDLVRARLPQTGETVQGYYGGRTTANVDCVITTGVGDNVWRCFRVHPCNIRSVGFFGDKGKSQFRFLAKPDVSLPPADEWGVIGDDADIESEVGGDDAPGDAVSSGLRGVSSVGASVVPVSVSPPPAFDSAKMLLKSGKLFVYKDKSGNHFPAVANRLVRGRVSFARQNIDSEGKLSHRDLGTTKLTNVTRVMEFPADGRVSKWVIDMVSPPPVSPPHVSPTPVSPAPGLPAGGDVQAASDAAAGDAGAAGDGGSGSVSGGAADVSPDELGELIIDADEPDDVDVVTGEINGGGHIAALTFTQHGPVAIAFRANTLPPAKAPAKAPPHALQNKAKGNLEVTQEDIAAGKLDAAMMKELKSWSDQAVLGPVIKGYVGQAMPCGWVHSLKLKNDERIYKSRMVAHGNRDPRDIEHIPTFSGTVDSGQFYVVLIYGLGEGWKLLFADVPTAFLRADADKATALVMRLPKRLPPGADKLGFYPGAAHRQQKAIYGTPEAGRLWQMKLLKEATNSGWHEFAQALMDYRENEKPRGASGSHVDDIGMVAKDPLKLLMTTFGEKVGIPRDEITVLQPGDSGKYNGCMWTMVSADTMFVGQKHYAADVTTDLTEKEKRKRISAHDFKRPAVVEVDMSLQKQQQQMVGVMGWLAKTQRHLAFAFSEISRTNTSPTAESFKLARQLCEYAKRTHEDLKFKGSVRKPVLLCWCDGAYHIETGESRMGYEIQLLDESDLEQGFTNAPRHNVIAWRSKRPERTVASSSEVELLALEHVCKAAPFYSRVVERMWGVAPLEFYFTDNQAVMDWVQMRWIKTVARLQGVLNNILADFQAKEGKAQLIWVPTKEQRADKYTKFLSQGRERAED